MKKIVRPTPAPPRDHWAEALALLDRIAVALERAHPPTDAELFEAQILRERAAAAAATGPADAAPDNTDTKGNHS